MNKVQTHVTTTISDEHFTPFASLLFHLPLAIRQVFGDKATFLYEYHPIRGLEVSIWPNDSMLYRVDGVFERTAYSFAEIKQQLSGARLVLPDSSK